MKVIKNLFIRFWRGGWPKSGEGFPLTRDLDEGRFFGRENIIVAVSLFGLGLILFGVI